MPALAGASRWL